MFYLIKKVNQLLRSLHNYQSELIQVFFRSNSYRNFLPDFRKFISRFYVKTLPVIGILLSACTSTGLINQRVVILSTDQIEKNIFENKQNAFPLEYHGRLAVLFDDQVNEQRHYSMRFYLKFLPGECESSDIELKSPFGNTLAVIKSNCLTASLEMPGKPLQEAPDVELLMIKILGFALPVNGLPYWLQTRASPGSSAQKLEKDNLGRTVLLEQDGWSINYHYRVKNSISYLSRLDMHFLQQSQNDPSVNIKLLLD
jgi:outer membrane lipoprotein LolB